MRHVPVLLKEIVQYLQVPKEGTFIDCNLGDAGHTEAVIKSLEGNVQTFGFDLDQDAICRAESNLKDVAGFSTSKHHFFRKNFRFLKKTLMESGYIKNVNDQVATDGNGQNAEFADAILFDLGISSYEIDESGRGFSFQKNEPLRMTFGTSSGSTHLKDGESPDHVFTAYDIVNTWDEENIADIIYAYGEDKYARRIANAIVEEREKRKKETADLSHDKTSAAKAIEEGHGGIETSAELAEIIKKAYPSFARFGKIHPATRTFQALRITVNDELRALQDALPQAVEILKKGGRLAVISFHSLEDRIVKNFFKHMADEGILKIISKKPITPSEAEIGENPRSRSSKLRIVEKIS